MSYSDSENGYTGWPCVVFKLSSRLHWITPCHFRLSRWLHWMAPCCIQAPRIAVTGPDFGSEDGNSGQSFSMSGLGSTLVLGFASKY